MNYEKCLRFNGRIKKTKHRNKEEQKHAQYQQYFYMHFFRINIRVQGRQSNFLYFLLLFSVNKRDYNESDTHLVSAGRNLDFSELLIPSSDH